MTVVEPTTPTLGRSVEQAVPDAVRLVLSARRISHRAAAEHLAVHPTGFSLRMNGKQRFTVAELIDLAALADVPVTVFLDRAELAAWVQNWK